MPTSEAMKKAVKRYQEEKTDLLRVRVPKGKKQVIQSHATDRGESLTHFVTRAIDETMERDKNLLP